MDRTAASVSLLLALTTCDALCSAAPFSAIITEPGFCFQLQPLLLLLSLLFNYMFPKGNHFVSVFVCFCFFVTQSTPTTTPAFCLLALPFQLSKATAAILSWWLSKGNGYSGLL